MSEPLPHAVTASPPVTDTPPATRTASGDATAPSRLLRGRALWDWAAAVLLVGLAFVLASAPARNTDVWMHLATGRALWTGAAGPTVDPFAYTTSGVAWTNPCWLSDLAAYGLCANLGSSFLWMFVRNVVIFLLASVLVAICWRGRMPWLAVLTVAIAVLVAYGLYANLGSSRLVVVKSGLMVLLAAVLLGICWRGPVRWLAALSVAIGLVALGPYMELRPVCVSYLFLGVTLWWVLWVRRRSAQAPPESAALAFIWYLPLLVLFVAWANLDRWFVLGPAVLVLCWLGGLVQYGFGKTDVRGPGLAALIGLFTPLVSPSHIHSITVLPTLLAGSAVAPDAELVVPGMGLPPASLAYFLLIGIGVFAFAFSGRRLCWPAVLVWSVLLAVSLYDRVAIPFFAVVAGPIAGLHLQSGAQRRLAVGEESATPRGQRTGLVQLATLLLLIGALATAWPGWLQGAAAEPRAWDVMLDPSLTEAGTELARWHDAGLNLGRGYHFSASSADAVAWLCPQEKSFADDRPGLFPADVRAEDTLVKLALLGSNDADWRSVLRARQITHLIVYDTADRRLRVVLRRLFAVPREWRPIYLRGRTVVFAWAAAEQAGHAGDLPQLPTIDLSARAFQPAETEQVAESRPPRMWEGRTWADAFLRPATVPNLGRGEALVYLTHFESQRPTYLQKNEMVLESSLAASAVGLGASAGALPAELAPGCGLRCGMVQASQRPLVDPQRRVPEPIGLFTGETINAWLTQCDLGPPASALLAVRAARRAVQDNPDDAVAYFLLGQGYLRLMRDTVERKALAAAPWVARVREAQVAAALNQALRLQPTLLAAHEALTAFYDEARYYDLTLRHLRSQLVLLRMRPVVPGSAEAEALAQRITRMEEVERQLADRVNDLTLLVRARAYDRQGIVKRAAFAQEQGLPGLALEMLRSADSATLGRGGTLLKLQLALIAGEANGMRPEFAPSTDSEQGDDPEALDFAWLQVQLGAADGAYRDADTKLAALTTPDGFDVPELRLRKASLGTIVAILAGRCILDQCAPQPRVLSAYTVSLPSDAGRAIDGERHQAEIACLRGLLALEAAEVRQATERFHSSLVRWDEPSDGAALLARHYLTLAGPQGKRGGP
jgi:hypothetical protein